MDFLPALDFTTTEGAFYLGHYAALESGEPGGAHVDESFRDAHEAILRHVGSARVVTWPSGAESRIVLRAAGTKTIEIGPECERSFVQGVFARLVSPDVDAHGVPRLSVAHGEAPHVEYLLSVLGLPPLENGTFEGVAAVDALGRILAGAPTTLPTLRAFFDQITTHVTHLNEPPIGPRTDHALSADLGHPESESQRGATMRVELVHPEARLPMKEHVSDSGYDLTLLYEKKRFGKTILFGTGVIVEPPFGWYFDVVPRSSIIKQGYILANSVGVIDRSYRGEIFVPLLKIDEQASELELPARIVQLIPRPVVHFPVEHTPSLTRTTRGSGGFGSTGK